MISLRASLRPSRRLVVLFVAMTLMPSVLLIVFGWRLLQQDREIERQQIAERRAQVAELIPTELWALENFLPTAK